MNFIDWFAGVGGFRKGLELAGHNCIGFCEYDDFAIASYTSMHLITDEQREYLNTLTLRKRQKEILKEEYRHGEWFTKDVCNVKGSEVPKAELWTFGAPCQDFSVAGRRAGLNGKRSNLIREIFRTLSEIEKSDRPEWLIYENVKGMLSSQKGWDFGTILCEMDELGYDGEWQIFNSKNYVPQNRERVYLIGHLRNGSSPKILPIERADTTDSVSIIGHRKSYRRNTQIFAQDGITEALDTAAGGGRGHYTMFLIDKSENGQPRSIANCITSREDRGVSTRKQDGTSILIPVLTPDRANKQQNGRRFKEDNEDMFTLTSQDRHGVAIKQATKQGVIDTVITEKYGEIAIRKLTPRECFRLQGWTDDYFDKAEFMNSDSQLYKQAGNGVTVNVVYDIGKRLKEYETIP